MHSKNYLSSFLNAFSMIRSIRDASNTVCVLHSLFSKLRIPVSSFTIEKELQDHPDYPSMLAPRDCLMSWNVPNEAFKIDKTSCDLKKNPLPFVAHLKRVEGDFVLVQGIFDDDVTFHNKRKGALFEFLNSGMG